MKKRIATVIATALLWTGVATIPALADGGPCVAGGGTQKDCHIYINGVSTHCFTYTEGGGINCKTVQ